MLGRAVASGAALLVLGLAGGYAAATVDDPAPTSRGAAAPVPAVSPAVPVTVTEPFTPDIDLPTMPTELDLGERTLGTPPDAWAYLAPTAWPATQTGFAETRFVPADNRLGGYGMRVRVVDERQTTAQMAAAKLEALQTSFEDVAVLQRTTDTLMVTFRSAPEGWQRFNLFRWFPRAGTDEAGLELAVTGRGRDLPGMRTLLARVTVGVRPLG